METSPSIVKLPSDPQVGKLHERMLSAACKSGVARFVKKASGIITPASAQNTSLIPRGWRVKEDDLEGDVSLANLDYSTSPVWAGESYVPGDWMLNRVDNAYGSLGFSAALLKAQNEGKEIFPVKSRGKHYFVMPRTILLDRHQDRQVACFEWRGKSWKLFFKWLGVDNGIFYGNARFVRPGKLSSAS